MSQIEVDCLEGQRGSGVLTRLGDWCLIQEQALAAYSTKGYNPNGFFLLPRRQLLCWVPRPFLNIIIFGPPVLKLFFSSNSELYSNNKFTSYQMAPIFLEMYCPVHLIKEHIKRDLCGQGTARYTPVHFPASRSAAAVEKSTYYGRPSLYSRSSQDCAYIV